MQGDQPKCLLPLTVTDVIMFRRANRRTVEAAVPAAILKPSQATSLSAEATALWAVHPERKFYQNGSQSRGYNALNTRTRNHGFTLAELLVSIAELVLVVFFVTSLLNSATTITTLGNKRMGADSQARQLLDWMAIDFAQMVKRADVDYYLKSPTNVQSGNDQIAFYSAVSGYYPSTGSQSPVSVVAYRMNSVAGTTAFNKLERLGKGLVWNGVSSTDTPVVFLPLTISANWPYATNTSPDPASPPAYETVGPQVFRFEYYYLLKNGTLSITPWDTSVGHTSVSGMQDVAAIAVDIAVVDPQSKVLLADAQVTTLVPQLTDFAAGMIPGQLLAQWQSALDANTSMPRPAISGIRLYERYFYLSPPTL